jgi:hypothetical protein
MLEPAMNLKPAPLDTNAISPHTIAQQELTMMKRLVLATTPLMIGLGIAVTTPVSAGSEIDAKALYDKHCTSCHGAEVFTREDRKMTSYDALHGQVRMCEQNLGLTWFDDQVNAVTGLLNDRYYQFENER